MAMAVCPILWYLALLKNINQIYASVGQIKGADNNMNYATLRLTHLPGRMFLPHFDLTFPQKKP